MSRLVSCRTCGHGVDVQAKVCPKCGRKNPTVGLGQTVGIFVLVLMFIGGLTMCS